MKEYFLIIAGLYFCDYILCKETDHSVGKITTTADKNNHYFFLPKVKSVILFYIK